MSVFRQNLPLQVVPTDNNPEGLKFQTVLESVEDKYLGARIDREFFKIAYSNLIRVEFTMSQFNFRFDSAYEKTAEADLIRIQKPVKIYKSQIRKAPRIELSVVIGYNIWTEPGRYEATLTDLSAVGMKITTDRQIQKNTLLSVNVYIPGKALRFICQGLVRWCKADLANPGEFTCGVQFTTLSNDAAKRVEKFIVDAPA